MILLCVRNICFYTPFFTSRFLNAIHFPGMVPGMEDVTGIWHFLLSRSSGLIESGKLIVWYGSREQKIPPLQLLKECLLKLTTGKVFRDHLGLHLGRDSPKPSSASRSSNGSGESWVSIPCRTGPVWSQTTRDLPK